MRSSKKGDNRKESRSEFQGTSSLRGWGEDRGKENLRKRHYVLRQTEERERKRERGFEKDFKKKIVAITTCQRKLERICRRRH